MAGLDCDDATRQGEDSDGGGRGGATVRGDVEWPRVLRFSLMGKLSSMSMCSD